MNLPERHPIRIFMHHCEMNTPANCVQYVDLEKWNSDPKLLSIGNRVLSARIDHALDNTAAERRTRIAKTYDSRREYSTIGMDEEVF